MSFNRSRFFIKCCKDCKPPQRYPGCGDHCEKYKQEKKEYEKQKECERKNRPAQISKNDFDMCLCMHSARKYKGR